MAEDGTGWKPAPTAVGGRDRRPWRQVSNLPIEWSRWEQSICVAETELNNFVASFVANFVDKAPDKARDKDNCLYVRICG